MSSVSSLSFLFLFLPCSSLSPLLLSPLSLFSLSLGDDTKWPTRVDVSLNLNTSINASMSHKRVMFIPVLFMKKQEKHGKVNPRKQGIQNPRLEYAHTNTVYLKLLRLEAYRKKKSEKNPNTFFHCNCLKRSNSNTINKQSIQLHSEGRKLYTYRIFSRYSEPRSECLSGYTLFAAPSHHEKHTCIILTPFNPTFT